MSTSQTGFTTSEFLVAAVVGLLVTGAALALCAAGNRAVAALAAGHAAWSETRAVATLWSSEWRGAGYDPTGGSGAGIVRLDAVTIELSADWNGDGALLPTDRNPNERLAYALAPGSWRRGVNDGPRLLAAWPDSARFVYRGLSGLVLETPPAPDEVQLAEAWVWLPGARSARAIEVRWVAARRNPQGRP
ncbi:MAG: hypothetical protein ABR527_10315 [Gemmatimonadota bacterium]